MKEILDQYFPQLTENELKEEIQKEGRIIKVDQGEIVIDIDEKIQWIPLIYKGSLKVIREDEDGSEILLYYVTTGNTCAKSITCCMSNDISTIRAEAEEEIWFIAIPISCIDHWIVKYDSWRKFILSTYSHRFEELLNTVDELAFNQLDERLIHFIANKVRLSGEMNLKLSHQEIAYALHSSREVISRLLKKMEKMGKIKLGRGRIELLKDSSPL